MYELLKDIYPRHEDRVTKELARLELDSHRRIDLLARRDEIYAELQSVLGSNDGDSRKIAVIEAKLEALRRMAQITT